MMTAETLFILFISYVLLHIKPGPGQAFRIGCALDRGFASALSVTVGVSTICTIYFLVVAFSYNNVIQHFESLATTFKILGGLYLVYLGVHGFIKKNGTKQKETAPRTSNLLKFFAIGLVLSLSNPMDIVFFLSLLPSLIPLGELTITGIIQGALIVFFTGILIDILILSLVVLAHTTLIDNKYTKYIAYITNGAFILIGAFFICSALFLDNYELTLI